MCGRAYITYTEDELAARYLTENRKRRPLSGLNPNYNLSPTQHAPVVAIQGGVLKIEMMRWGLLPFWAKDLESVKKYSLINAKAEEIDQKRSYQIPFKKRRCIVPLSGFFEWKRLDEKSKQPYAIYAKDHSILSAAAVWEVWRGATQDEEIHSFALITTAANSFMKPIHGRMPVILDSKDESAWLNPENEDLEQLKKLLKPCPSKMLATHCISKLVNSPKNNRPEVLAPSED
jgi:putative SOS response-associated peptidase YedK